MLKAWLLGFAASALMLPGALSFATVLLVITSPRGDIRHSEMWKTVLNGTPGRACLWGTVLGVGFCALLGVLVGGRVSRPESASPGPFDELRRRLDRATARFEELTPGGSPSASSARAEVEGHLAYLGALLTTEEPDSRWLRGTGYIDAWRRLHAAEESLLLIASPTHLLSDALSDEARLMGSSIPQRGLLLTRLRRAVTSLGGTAACYLSEPAPPCKDEGDRKEADVEHADTPERADEARAALVHVRTAIDDFRDGRREGIIRARNRLFVTVVFAGITGCVLLYVAILSGASKSSIVAVTTFYLVGGTIGLFRQLQVALSSEGARQDDYSLGVVRLIHTPLFSGLAAVGGVVLVKLSQGQGNLSLPKTFNIQHNAYGLVAAGIFGLAPSLLLTSLQKRIDEYQTDLSKSDAGQAPAASGD
jgi:hypothetical protein